MELCWQTAHFPSPLYLYLPPHHNTHIVHEHKLVAVDVRELGVRLVHFRRVDGFAAAERAFHRVARDVVFQLGAHKGGAFAGLDVEVFCVRWWSVGSGGEVEGRWRLIKIHAPWLRALYFFPD